MARNYLTFVQSRCGVYDPPVESHWTCGNSDQQSLREMPHIFSLGHKRDAFLPRADGTLTLGVLSFHVRNLSTLTPVTLGGSPNHTASVPVGTLIYDLSYLGPAARHMSAEASRCFQSPDI